MKHWSRADGMPAAAANNTDVRRTLRNRSRYEVANRSYARGITLTLANDVVGTGPRLQMLTSDDAENRFVGAEFFAWAEAVERGRMNEDTEFYLELADDEHPNAEAGGCPIRC